MGRCARNSLVAVGTSYSIGEFAFDVHLIRLEIREYIIKSWNQVPIWYNVEGVTSQGLIGY